VLADGALKLDKLHTIQTESPELKSMSIEYFERQSTALKGQQ
jgi:hypothetical protein